MSVEDLRSDFYKYLDVVKHQLTQEEYVQMVKDNTTRSLDVLNKLLEKE